MYSRLESLLGRTTVHSAVRAAVLDACAEVHEQHPELRFVVGETGWPRGGRIRRTEPIRTACAWTSWSRCGARTTWPSGSGHDEHYHVDFAFKETESEA